MMRSASAAASATDRTRSPASSAFWRRGRPGAQPDPDVDARLGQVEGVGVALGPVADDGHLAALDQARVGVGLVVQLGHLSLPRRSWDRSPGCRVGALCTGVGVVAAGCEPAALQLRQGHAARPLELDDAEGADQVLEVVDLGRGCPPA